MDLPPRHGTPPPRCPLYQVEFPLPVLPADNKKPHRVRKKINDRGQKLGNLRDIQRILDIQPILPHQDFLDDAIITHALTDVWSTFQRPSL
jgi:hypothetical protein